jgi:sporulation protein YlmC with PRC-barrel domain
MKLVAEFNFVKAPATLGMVVRVGDNHHFTLNNESLEYHCQPNELLVITSLTHSGDKLGMLKDISLVIDGSSGHGVGAAVQPGERLGVMLQVKRGDEFRLPPAVLDYPVTVKIEATQYQVTNIEP